jgi:DNA polymerase-3 subunit delta'
MSEGYPEQHDTLEGVPEPAENPFLAGHGEAAAMLAAAHRAGKLPHALLFVGPPGIGKATLAFHLAHHLFRYPDPAKAPEALAAPDPKSTPFRLVAGAAHPSLLHLTRPASESGKGFKTVLAVDEVRRVGRFLSMTAHDGGWRVVIVDPADDMNRAAANALLKNLEEPPARTVFILIAHAPGSLLPTIRSRCQVVRFQPLPPDAVLEVLQRLNMQLPDSKGERQALAEQSGGSPRTGILLTQYGGGEIGEALTKAAREKDIPAWHKIADAVAGRDSRVHLALFNRHALDMLSRAASTAAEADDLARANSLAEAWQDALNAITETEEYNLDRKQHALTMIERLNAAMRM